MKKIRERKAQQEMVGFVLIVVLVVIALMIFLVISLRKPVQNTETTEVENMISSMLAYTTDCAITSEPDFDSMEQLIQSCYKNQKCANTKLMACDSMKKNLDGILYSVFLSENKYPGYEFLVAVMDNSTQKSDILYTKKVGNCTGASEGGSQSLAVVGDRKTKIDISMKLCS